jgi:hypothetical protein
LIAAPETFEHIGDVGTWLLDLEGRWAAERNRRRLEIDPRRAILDETVDVTADPAACWAYLTSPALRPRWEGPISIVETTAGSRRGVGTVAQCVTGRLATLEEIVDWQPYDHVGWRLAVPALGAVEATADLEPIEDGTRVRLRWGPPTDGHADPAEVARVQAERRAALARLATVAGSA